ncbi:PREDICTED: tetratricopeptide repeat protein 38 [Condylura cristata]|uniref:tetratricopeptide repeat protein 38 n=1 Tax=Condylura cristata TaxID=143302 RepID=UPI00064374B6|nr:PREDICTED: tetratricopeptide repeat protein 38 [Condylura cristata]
MQTPHSVRAWAGAESFQASPCASGRVGSRLGPREEPQPGRAEGRATRNGTSSVAAADKFHLKKSRFSALASEAKSDAENREEHKARAGGSKREPAAVRPTGLVGALGETLLGGTPPPGRGPVPGQTRGLAGACPGLCPCSAPPGSRSAPPSHRGARAPGCRAGTGPTAPPAAQAWRDAGLPLSTTSNEACRLFDATLTQYVKWTNDRSLGGIEGCLAKLRAADPAFGEPCGLPPAGPGRALGSGHATPRREGRLPPGRRAACTSPGGDRPFPSRARSCSPACSYVKGIYSFGLVETNLYDQALKLATEALSVNPTDAWSVHTVAHVHEMRAEVGAGLEFMRRSEAHWKVRWPGGCSGPQRPAPTRGSEEAGERLAAVRGWEVQWGPGRASPRLRGCSWAPVVATGTAPPGACPGPETRVSQGVLACGPVAIPPRRGSLDRCPRPGVRWPPLPACGLLTWDGPGPGATRVHRASPAGLLRVLGVSVGERWQELLPVTQGHSRDHVLLFNDAHFLMASLGAGASGTTQELLTTLQEASEYAGARAWVPPSARPPLPVSRCGAGRGAHALLEASPTDPVSVCRSLLMERDALKPNSPLTERLLRKAAAVHLLQ